MYAILSDTHIRIASLTEFFDILQSPSSNKTPPYQWAIDTNDKPASSSADTITSGMQLVLMDINVHPPEGFASTSHSLRKGATTVAYAIGGNMQKTFGGWAT
jgi:hypothetical protein